MSFSNLKKPKTMTLDLVKVGGAWRIADIKGPERIAAGLDENEVAPPLD